MVIQTFERSVDSTRTLYNLGAESRDTCASGTEDYWSNHTCNYDSKEKNNNETHDHVHARVCGSFIPEVEVT